MLMAIILSGVAVAGTGIGVAIARTFIPVKPVKLDYSQGWIKEQIWDP